MIDDWLEGRAQHDRMVNYETSKRTRTLKVNPDTLKKAALATGAATAVVAAAVAAAPNDDHRQRINEPSAVVVALHKIKQIFYPILPDPCPYCGMG
jgi:hypothetical protein